MILIAGLHGVYLQKIYLLSQFIPAVFSCTLNVSYAVRFSLRKVGVEEYLGFWSVIAWKGVS